MDKLIIELEQWVRFYHYVDDWTTFKVHAERLTISDSAFCALPLLSLHPCLFLFCAILFPLQIGWNRTQFHLRLSQNSPNKTTQINTSSMHHRHHCLYLALTQHVQRRRLFHPGTQLRQFLPDLKRMDSTDLAL